MFKQSVFKRILFFILCFLAVFSAAQVFAEEGLADKIYTFAVEENASSRVNVQSFDGEYVMVLPSCVKPESFIIYMEDSQIINIEGESARRSFVLGKSIDLNDFCKNGDYKLKIYGKDGGFVEVRFLFSENVPALFLLSDDPVEKGREWVESSSDKSNKATGNMLLLKENGETVHSGALTQIKGRGNSTWSEVKKPYQIKTADKVDLLQTGNPENKTKTWVLLANSLDPSVMNNSVMLNLGKVADMKTNIESTHVDLYYDGEYRGNYLLSEKVEVGDGRVSIEDMEDKNEEANEGTDIESLPVKEAQTDNGAFFTYCEGMKSPEDVTGGYLIEMDFEVRAKEEICYFRTTRGQYVVVKSPEYASFEEMQYIATLYQEYEDAVFNGGINPDTKKAYSDYVDIDSVACYFAVNELAIAKDFLRSSAYLYKNAGEDKLYMGPLWDYDLSLGKNKERENEFQSPYGVSVYNTDLGKKLLEQKDFCVALEKVYVNKIYPYVKDVLLNDGVKGSLSSEKERLGASATINYKMWHSDRSWEEHFSDMKNFLAVRAEYVDRIFKAYKNMASAKAVSYSDVKKIDWFFEDVTNVTALGFMKGTGEGLFEPYRTVTRAEVAQALYNMAGEKISLPDSAFTDVASDSWYAPAISWAVENGIINGFPDGLFRPDQKITREELAVILFRLEKNPVKRADISNFSDSSTVSPFASNAIEWAVSKKVIKGDDRGCLNPKAGLTAAELATLLGRYVKIQ